MIRRIAKWYIGEHYQARPTYVCKPPESITNDYIHTHTHTHTYTESTVDHMKTNYHNSESSSQCLTEYGKYLIPPRHHAIPHTLGLISLHPPYQMILFVAIWVPSKDASKTSNRLHSHPSPTVDQSNAKN
jgi:hypothetical protein